MKQPNEPKEEDCCNSGCSPCIFDVYEKQLKLYEKFLKSGETIILKDNGISDLDYTTFVLVSKVYIGSDHALLALKRSEPGCKVWWRPGAHFLFKYCINGTTCTTRAYTPLALNDAINIDFDFMVIIKRYDTGLVSKYLYSMDIGEQTVWRGPYGHYIIVPNKYNRVIMIAQGTGIAPFFSIISKILDDEDDMTKLILFFSCHSQSSILLRSELHSFQSYWNFSYKLFVSQTVDISSLKYKEPVVNHRLSCGDFDYLKPFGNDQFLLCGSMQFMQQFEKFLLDNGIASENIVLF